MRIALVRGRAPSPSHRLAESRIRVGVVGLGSFGSHHARHYAANPAAILTAVADADAGRAAAAAAKYGAASFADYRDLIGTVDAVSVAAPAIHHHAIAAALVDAGIHVLVEKPLAVTASEARDVVQRAARTGAIVAAGHVERFSPITAALRAGVSRPRRIACIRRTMWSGRSADVDVVLDLMIHDIDLLLTLAKSPVASVAASGVIAQSGLTDEAEAWLTFADGMVATLSASRIADENERKISVTEPDTAWTADLSAPSLSSASRSQWGAEASALALSPHDNLGAEIADFLDAVATGTAPEVDGAAGVAAVEMANRIQAAIADADVPAKREASR